MEHREHSALEREVGVDGSLTIPSAALAKRGLGPGAKVEVRITELSLSRALQIRGVTEEEIDRIQSMQWEGRENVVRFLATEGALAGHKEFRRRVEAWRKR